MYYFYKVHFLTPFSATEYSFRVRMVEGGLYARNTNKNVYVFLQFYCFILKHSVSLVDFLCNWRNKLYKFKRQLEMLTVHMQLCTLSCVNRLVAAQQTTFVILDALYINNSYQYKKGKKIKYWILSFYAFFVVL